MPPEKQVVSFSAATGTVGFPQQRIAILVVHAHYPSRLSRCPPRPCTFFPAAALRRRRIPQSCSRVRVPNSLLCVRRTAAGKAEAPRTTPQRPSPPLSYSFISLFAHILGCVFNVQCEKESKRIHQDQKKYAAELNRIQNKKNCIRHGAAKQQPAKICLLILMHKNFAALKRTPFLLFQGTAQKRKYQETFTGRYYIFLRILSFFIKNM